jgi:DNA polymerase
MKSGSSLLESLAEQIKSCRLCPLAQGRNHPVPGEGPPRARIVIVGEGPGKDEDEIGRPFIGRAGRLLDSALQSTRIRRERVFITNVVKCRPPKNRVPSKGEWQTCTKTYLIPQLEFVDPDLVVLLGRTALQVLLGEQTLRKMRGRIVTRNGKQYLPTYHPAAILRNPNLNRVFVSDLKKIHRIVRTPRGSKTI